MEVDAPVWVRVPDAALCWAPGVLRSHAKGVLEVALDAGGALVTVPDAKDASGEMLNCKLRNSGYGSFATQGRGGVDDLIVLPHLHEPALLEVLSIRFAAGCIYTNVGPILLAVNPYARFATLYSDRMLEEHYTRGLLVAQGIPSPPLPPHAFAVADSAYRAMMLTASGLGAFDATLAPPAPTNQAMLVSGESGAGKTETTKIVLRYLATVGRPKATGGPRRTSTRSSPIATASSATTEGGASSPHGTVSALPSVERRVLDSSPLLESFGNAKTVRNDNSSRYGKWSVLGFNARGELIGAAVQTYLLEKVRVTAQAAGERGYHVFYQVVAGAPPEDRVAWHLPPATESSASAFSILSSTPCVGTDDAAAFVATADAMTTMGISAEAQRDVWAMLAGILHLGNVRFVEGSGGGLDAKGGASACHFAPASAAAVTAAAALLGVTREGLEVALTGKEITAVGDKYRVNFTTVQCASSIEATVKALYSKLFNWIVGAINRQLASQDEFDRWTGVLDIFGFECFASNSLEQLCINYANEALQAQFNAYIFALEQEEYAREGIDWNSTWPDNSAILELIQSRRPPGLLALLDEQCLVGGGSDEGYSRRVAETFKANACVKVTAKHARAQQFVVVHFAGEVTYTCSGWLEKNRDTLHKEAVDLFATSSSKPFVRATFAGMEAWAEIPSVSDAYGMRLIPSLGGHPPPPPAITTTAPPPPTSSKPGGLTTETVGRQFQSQLGSLMEVIKGCSPHYVRCLKPNPRQAPRELVPGDVIAQLRYGGVLEAVRVQRLGFPVRLPHASFVSMYKCIAVAPRRTLSPRKKGAEANTSSAPSTATLPAAAPLSVEPPPSAAISAGDARAQVRALLARCTVPDVDATTVQVGATKVFLKRVAHDALCAARNVVHSAAAVILQAAWRRHAAVQRYKSTRKLIVTLQALVRGHALRMRLLAERRAAAATRLAAFARRSIARCRYTRLRKSVLRMQACTRGRVTRAMLALRRRNARVAVVQSLVRMQRVRRSFKRQRTAAVTLQCWARVRKACGVTERLRSAAKDLVSLRAAVGTLRDDNRLLEAALTEARAEAAEWRSITARLSHGRITTLIPRDDVEAVVSELLLSAPTTSSIGASAAATSGTSTVSSPPAATEVVLSLATSSSEKVSQEGALHDSAIVTAPTPLALLSAQGATAGGGAEGVIVIGGSAEELAALLAKISALTTRAETAEAQVVMLSSSSLPGAGIGAGVGGGGVSAEGLHGGAGATVTDTSPAASIPPPITSSSSPSTIVIPAPLTPARKRSLSASPCAPSSAAAPVSSDTRSSSVDTGEHGGVTSLSDIMSTPAQQAGAATGAAAGAAATGEGVGGEGRGEGGGGRASFSSPLPTTSTSSVASPPLSSDMLELLARRSKQSTSEAEKWRREAEAARKRAARAEEAAAAAAVARLRAEEKAAGSGLEAQRLASRVEQLTREITTAHPAKLAELNASLGTVRDALRVKASEAEAALAAARAARTKAEALEVGLAETKDELIALREKKEMDADTKLALARRLEVVVVEKQELTGAMADARRRVAELERRLYEQGGGTMPPSAAGDGGGGLAAARASASAPRGRGSPVLEPPLAAPKGGGWFNMKGFT